MNERTIQRTSNRSIYLSIYPSIDLSVCRSIDPSAFMYIYIYTHTRTHLIIYTCTYIYYMYIWGKHPIYNIMTTWLLDSGCGSLSFFASDISSTLATAAVRLVPFFGAMVWRVEVGAKSQVVCWGRNGCSSGTAWLGTSGMVQSCGCHCPLSRGFSGCPSFLGGLPKSRKKLPWYSFGLKMGPKKMAFFIGIMMSHQNLV